GPPGSIQRVLGRLSIAISLAGSLLAQPDYFPLHPGNQWIYRAGGRVAGATLTLEITRSAEFNGRGYVALHGLAERDYWLRQDGDGRILEYDPGENRERVWYAFRSPVDQVYETAVPFCCGRASIRSRAAAYKGPIGEFDTALEIAYPGVFQVGLERELFLPYIGMVYRGVNTGGPTFASYDLIYARIGGVTVVSEPELSFSLTLDRAVYVYNLLPNVRPLPVALTARLTLRNTQPKPVDLMYPSGQAYDLVLRKESGEVVYRWSEGKVFTQALRNESVGPGERNHVIVATLIDKDGGPIAAGRYIAEAWLTTTGPRVWSASAGFEIQHLTASP
ncbi:MAG: BsuPI-related putative proteinase inhibitor, partial [Bryobacteraceae bacterium]